MPDTFTHLLIAIPAGRRFFQKPWRYIFYSGIVFPDILSRGLSAVFKNAHDYFAPLHTPIGLMVFAVFFTALFEMRYWKKVLSLLTAGIAFHFIPDALQSHIYGGGYIWFFPFSWWTYKKGLFAPDASLYFLPILLVIIFIMEKGKKREIV
jgi:hypothetical protein